MDLLEQQKRRRRRGFAVLGMAMFYLVLAMRTADAVNLSAAKFLVIYSSGIILGAGIAIVVASYKMTREILQK